MWCCLAAVFLCSPWLFPMGLIKSTGFVPLALLAWRMATVLCRVEQSTCAHFSSGAGGKVKQRKHGMASSGEIRRWWNGKVYQEWAMAMKPELLTYPRACGIDQPGYTCSVCASYTLTCAHTAEGICGTQQPCCRLCQLRADLQASGDAQ